MITETAWQVAGKKCQRYACAQGTSYLFETVLLRLRGTEKDGQHDAQCDEPATYGREGRQSFVQDVVAEQGCDGSVGGEQDAVSTRANPS